jgi:hypothetical protein
MGIVLQYLGIAGGRRLVVRALAPDEISGGDMFVDAFLLSISK